MIIFILQGRPIELLIGRLEISAIDIILRKKYR